MLTSQGLTPRLRRGSIERRALLASLADPGEEQVVAVVAPAGFGKTTLLAQWAAQDARPAGWLSVERGDNDPVELLRRIASVVEAHPAAPLAEPADEPMGSAEQRLATRILQALAGHDRGYVLVLDDAHLLTDPAARDRIDRLVRRLPAGTQLALGCRVEPRLPLERWRAEGRLRVIGPSELTLDASECGQLLAAVGVRLSARELEAIRDRTAGWAAGVYLVGRSLADGSGVVPEPAGDAPPLAVSDYLVHQVLDTLSVDDRRLLVTTALFDELTGALCDAVLGVAGSAGRLVALSRGLWFLQAMDAEQRAFRCHSLLRGVLRAELERTRAADIPGLHRAAASWYLEQGEIVPAVEHALAGGDRGAAARIIAAHSQPLHARGAMATLHRWYGQLQAADIEANPSVAAMAAWLAIFDGRTAAFQQWKGAFEAADHTGAPEDGSASHASAGAMLRALDCADGPEQMRADVAIAAAAEPEWSPWRGTVQILEGYAQLMLGDRDGAAGSFRQVSVTPVGRAGAWSVAVAELGLQAIEGRDWPRAEELSARFRTVVGQVGLGDYVTSLLGLVVDARVRLHRGDTNRARALLMEAQMLRRLVSWGAPWLGVRNLTELARAQLLVGDTVGARACVAQMDEILERRPQLGRLVDEAAAIRERCRARERLEGATSLTPAELRLLPLLQSYLSFREIGERLGVSHNTIKTQALSVYAKFGVTSRSEAVDFAAEIGLLVPLFELGRARSSIGATA